MDRITQIKALVNLSAADGTLAEKEKNFIMNIGKAHDIRETDLEELLRQKHDVIIPEDLSEEHRFDFIFSLIQLMKIDERMYKEELSFCAQIVEKLGYDKQVMFDLLLHVHSGEMPEDEKSWVRDLTRRYRKTTS